MDDSFEGPAHVDWPRLRQDVPLGRSAAGYGQFLLQTSKGEAVETQWIGQNAREFRISDNSEPGDLELLPRIRKMNALVADAT